jgi:hypothetical protein
MHGQGPLSVSTRLAYYITSLKKYRPVEVATEVVAGTTGMADDRAEMSRTMEIPKSGILSVSLSVSSWRSPSSG